MGVLESDCIRKTLVGKLINETVALLKGNGNLGDRAYLEGVGHGVMSLDTI